MSDEPEFQPSTVYAALVQHGVRFVVIGGLAGAYRGSPLLTFDLDICYARDDENLEALAATLRELGSTLRGVDEDVPFQLDAESLRNGDSFTFSTRFGAVDCLGTPAGTSGFDDLDSGATMLNIDGADLRVASIDDLIRMKRAAGRDKDKIGLEWLRAMRDEIEGDD
jgi:hypothetical protein